MSIIIEKLVGDLGQKQRFRAYKARMKRLQEPYRSAGAALERYLMYLGPSNDGATLVAMLDDLADLLERSEADGVGIRDLVGSEPVEFAEAFMANYAGGSWIRGEQQRLAQSIDRAAGDGTTGEEPR